MWTELCFVLFCNPRPQHLMTTFRNKIEMKLEVDCKSGPPCTQAIVRIRREILKTSLHRQIYQHSSNSRVTMHRSSENEPCWCAHLRCSPDCLPPPGWWENRNVYCFSYLSRYILLWQLIKLMLVLDFCLFIQQTLREHLQCPDLYNRMHKTDKAEKDKNGICSQEAGGRDW